MNQTTPETIAPADDTRTSGARRALFINNDRDYFIHHRLPIVERLISLGFDVTVAAGGRTETPPQAKQWRFVPLPFDRLSIGPFSNFSLLWRCFKLLREARPDRLHLLTLKPAIFGGLAAVLLRLAGNGPKRILITIPGLGRLMSPGGTGAGWLSPAARWFVGSMIRFLSNRKGVRFSFETAHDRDFWLNGGHIRADNSAVINGAGVDPVAFQPTKRAVSKGPMRILFASRFLRSKGLGAFIEAARHFADNPKVEFAVAGMEAPGDPDSMSAAELSAHPAIAFLGEITDMPELLATTDIVCLPTRYGEGVPRILIEAAACGIPILATDIAGCKEIAEDGVTGTFVSADDPAGLADALIAAVNNYLEHPGLLQTQGQAGRRRFLDKGFDTKSVVDDFMKLLLDEAGSGGR